MEKYKMKLLPLRIPEVIQWELERVKFESGEDRLRNQLNTWLDSIIVPSLDILKEYWTTFGRVANQLMMYWSHFPKECYKLDSYYLPMTWQQGEFGWDKSQKVPTSVGRILDKLYSEIDAIRGKIELYRQKMLFIQAWTPPATFLDLWDTPADYIGHTNKGLGVNQWGQIAFITPPSKQWFLHLSDTPNSYPTDSSLLICDPTEHVWIDPVDAFAWKIVPLAYTGFVTELTLSGEEIGNNLYLVDIGNLMQCGEFSITLGAIGDGNRIGFKIVEGESTAVHGSPPYDKIIKADTANGTIIFGEDMFRLDFAYSYIFRYSEILAGYVRTESYPTY
jgi:hypothetical protein